MAASRLLLIIYLAFISLGLPDGVLGVAWPAMRLSLHLPLEAMGLVTTLLMCLSATSSVLSGRLLVRWGTGTLTTASCAMTSFALAGYALSPTPLWLLVCTVPLGLGQGAVDTAMNLHVANHYTARHMNWLHCFWGVGASLGPVVMTATLTASFASILPPAWGWRLGYATLAVAQGLLTVVLLRSVLAGLWHKNKPENKPEDGPRDGPGDGAGDGPGREPGAASQGTSEQHVTPQGTLHVLSDQVLAVLLFFVYVGMEFSVGLWLNSLLVEGRHLPVTFAGLSVAAFYAAIMGGRFLAGVLSVRLSNQTLIRGGLLLACAAALGLSVAVHEAPTMLCVMALGLGCAPVYPGLMHETPRRFKAAVTQRLMGLQVGAACLGGSLISGGMGLVLSGLSLEALCPAVTAMTVLLVLGNERLGRSQR